MTAVSTKHDYRLWTHPVVIGSGQRHVREGAGASGLRLLDRQAFNADVVVLSYQPARLDDDEPGLLFEGWRSEDEQSITALALAMLGIVPDRDDDVDGQTA